MDDDAKDIYTRLNQLEVSMATMVEWKSNMDRLHTDLMGLVQELNSKMDKMSAEQHQRIGEERTKSKVVAVGVGILTLLISGVGSYALLM